MDDNQNGGIVIAVIIILLLLVGDVLVGANWNKWFSSSRTETSQSGTSTPSLDIDPNAGQWNGETPQDKGGEEVR